MPESAQATQSGPSLEQILWRAMDRWKERPALVDVEEFADHIEGVFEGELPEEKWVGRFFAGEDRMHRKAPADMAEAIARVTKDRLAVYEFDLRRLEYVIVEDAEKVVVVSDFGQFALGNDDVVRRAIESAVVPAAGAERGGSGPRAYLVRAGGEVVAVDVKKAARSLEQLLVRQVSMPAVDRPGTRLAPFGAARRTLTEAREARALRQDARTQKAVPAPPRPPPAATAGAQTAVFLLMPDGTLLRPEMGAATRWREMVGSYARNLSTIATVGERALARSEGIAAVRADSAPVRTLGADDLAGALSRGARLLPARARGDGFWIQPESASKPLQHALAHGAAKGDFVGQPLQLGEITGDPWADWALTEGGRLSQKSVPPQLAERVRDARGRDFALAGAPVVGFRAPDGSVLLQRAGGTIRLAALSRSEEPLAPGFLQPRDPLAARSGALPSTALAALRMALEHTASAAGYRLPLLRIDSAPDALEAGAALQLAPLDPRRRGVRLAGPMSIADRGSGQVAQLVLSMPFPNEGDLHVGGDLSEALQTWLGAAVGPAGQPFGSLGLGGAAGASDGAGGIALRVRGGHDGVDWAGLSGLPISIRDLARRGPLGAPRGELVAAAPSRRPLNPGEEEIVIPMPLWAQLGRGQLSETDHIMASPFAPAGYAPPLGIYRLAGPSALELAAPPGRSTVVASALGGPRLLGRVAIDDGETVVTRRGRILIGAPLAQGTSLSGSTPPLAFAAAAEVSSALSDMTSSTRRAADSAHSFATDSSRTGLQPGLWSRHRRSSSGAHQSWEYSSSNPDRPRSSGGVDLASFSQPVYPSLPTSLRFRYVGAPLWWSGARTAGLAGHQGGDTEASPAGRALRSGLRAANSAASLWRSILVASPQWGSAGADLSGGMDSAYDLSVHEMSSLSRSFDALSAASVAGGASAQGASAYVGIDRSGAAGTLPKGAAARAKADSIEMSIVAAIPPSAPPLESTGAAAGFGDAPRARQRQQGHGGPDGDKEHADAVSHSKIEGSVDAIAQRIYHRIRRRIQSDRERFGG